MSLFLICFALKTCEGHDAGAFHCATISGNFRSRCEWNGSAQVEIFGQSGPPPELVLFDWSVGSDRKLPFASACHYTQ